MINLLQSQKQQHKILPHHIALLNLLHLDSMSLEQRIEDEINENPALEESNNSDDALNDKFSKETVQDFQNWEEYGYDDIPDYKTEYENYLPADKMPDRQIAETLDFRQELKKQYRFADLDETKYKIADFIIDSLDESGFLTNDLESIAEEISFKQNIWVHSADLEPVLKNIQELDPIGCGSRNSGEFFLLQLEKLNTKSENCLSAIKLVRDHFDDLHASNIEKIRREMKMRDGELKDVLQLLASLKSRPFAGTENITHTNNSIFPDFIITVEADEVFVSLARQRSASLHVNQAWAETVQQMDNDKTTDRGTRMYLRSKLASAQWFIKAIRERETNMLKVIRAIVQFQTDYFKGGGDTMQLKPMVLKNIAEIVNLDISTVSRITCNKYADTPFGLILLKDLFTEGLSNKEGTITSNKVIQRIVEDLVQKEDKKKPYTDQQLADILSREGYIVARRTIAKYRDQLNIPVAQMRALFL
ncbi:MAG TPA: RNA polymerase factor sigma-54 [Puia sp.]|jgi:RNA polymerase sigma-54 factor|nr:RNA polymerase factor sigma-54 [Puia sp.]